MGLSPSPFTLTLGRRGSVIFFPLLSTRIALDDHVIEERRTLREEFGRGSKSRKEFLTGLGLGDPCFRGQFVWVI